MTEGRRLVPRTRPTMRQIHPIRQWLNDTGVTITDLAYAAGVSRSWLSKIIAGRVLCGAAASHKIARATCQCVRAEQISGWGRA
jgi:predicted transcriptional regulator